MLISFMWNVNLLIMTCHKRCATTYSNYNNIIIMTTLARLIMTKHQVAIVLSNFELFNIRLLSAIIIMLSKTEPKTQDNKKVLDFESDHLFFSSDSDLIINFFFARGKRLKHINIFSNQNTFKFKLFIILTTFISSLSD